MNHEQWEALKAATQGHTPGPWEVRKVNSTPCVFCTQRATNLLIEGWGDRHDIHLAAAAPDLLAEVERLRGWLEYLIAAEAVITRQYTTVESTAPLLANSARVLLARALNGAEVPK